MRVARAGGEEWQGRDKYALALAQQIYIVHNFLSLGK